MTNSVQNRHLPSPSLVLPENNPSTPTSRTLREIPEDNRGPSCLPELRSARANLMRRIEEASSKAEEKIGGFVKSQKDKITFDGSALKKYLKNQKVERGLNELIAQGNLVAAQGQRIDQFIQTNQNLINVMAPDAVKQAGVLWALHAEPLLAEAEQHLLQLHEPPTSKKSWKELSNRLKAAHLDPARTGGAAPDATTYLMFSLALIKFHSPDKRTILEEDAQDILNEVNELSHMSPRLLAGHMNDMAANLQAFYNMSFLNNEIAEINRIPDRESNAARMNAFNALINT